MTLDDYLMYIYIYKYNIYINIIYIYNIDIYIYIIYIYVSALMRSPFATLPALPFFALARGVDRGW